MSDGSEPVIGLLTSRHPGRGAARSDAPQNRDLFDVGAEIPCLRRGTSHRSAHGMTIHS
jgi:hypothetical protein